jgi:hypothetical protein
MSASVFRTQADVFLSRHMAPEVQSRLLAETAIKGREELIRSGRAPNAYATFVDGEEGVPEARVSPDGVIAYRFVRIGEAAAFAMSYLVTGSPVASGRFRSSFVYAVGQHGWRQRHRKPTAANFYNVNRIIRPASFDPSKVTDDVDEILIFNTQPYSRKVDVQLAGNRRIRFSVPADALDEAAIAVRRRFPDLDARRIYTVRFSWQYKLKTGSKAGRPVENPALVISVR